MSQKWRNIIRDAKERGGFFHTETDNARSWKACAIGELDSMQKGILQGDIADERENIMDLNLTRDAYFLGMKFESAIHHDDYTLADTILTQIETLITANKFYKKIAVEVKT